MEGVQSSACSPPTSFSGQQCHHFDESVQKSGGENVGAVEEMMWVLQRGHSGDDLALCKYHFRKGDLFIISWARV